MNVNEYWIQSDDVRYITLQNIFTCKQNITFQRIHDNCNVTNIKYKIDHSMVKLEIRLNNIKKGQGFWKFNNSLLKDHTYVNKVKQIILDTKTEYSPMIVIRDSILDIPDKIYSLQ